MAGDCNSHKNKITQLSKNKAYTATAKLTNRLPSPRPEPKKKGLFSSNPTGMQTLKTNSEQGPSSHETQPLCLFSGEQGNVNSVYSEFQHLFRNPSDLLRQSRGSGVLHISPRMMINEEMLNITSKARFSG